MNTRMYAMEREFLSQLLADRKEILGIARSLTTADEMRAAREELLSKLSVVNITPKTDEEVLASYSIDDNGVATIPIVGELTPRAETDACGAYTADALTEYGFIIAATMAADKDPKVSEIEYFIDSPGGYVDGVAEAVRAVSQASKPTSALVGGMAASAAYWIASQTGKITAMHELSRVGSVGVAVEEFDDSKMLENAGVTRRVYTSTEAPDKRPDTSTPEGQAKVVSGLDEIHSVFVSHVAKGRNTTADEVNRNFGKGAVVIASKAVTAGMIDEVWIDEPKGYHLEDVISRREASNQFLGSNPWKRASGEDITGDPSDELEANVYEAAVEIGVRQERERRNSITALMGREPDNDDLAAVCNAAIEAGTDPSSLDFKADIERALKGGFGFDGDNAPLVRTIYSQLSPEEQKVCAAMGLTENEFLTEGKEK